MVGKCALYQVCTWGIGIFIGKSDCILYFGIISISNFVDSNPHLFHASVCIYKRLNLRNLLKWVTGLVFEFLERVLDT